MSGSAADEILQQLLACTSAPPRPTVDPEDVLLAAAEMVERRAQILSTLEEERIEGASRALLTELEELDKRWQAALVRARFQMGERATGARRLGSYQR